MAAASSHSHVEREIGEKPEGESPEWELLQSGYRYALSLSHHRADAEDLVQQAWLNLCQRYGAATSRAALYTTIRNLFIDRCRRARVVAFDSLDEAPADLATPAPAAPGTNDDLELLLGALRPGEREAIYLHHVAGHTAEEIGVLTRQPRGTVLSLLHRAFKKLRNAAATARGVAP
ncbi:MAG: RNA polymerase sigma factor [Opitutaceae bacterium]|nr:RNA polymerase sigma factor [Opitutaceae bacterium]